MYDALVGNFVYCCIGCGNVAFILHVYLYVYANDRLPFYTPLKGQRSATDVSIAVYLACANMFLITLISVLPLNASARFK